MLIGVHVIASVGLALWLRMRATFAVLHRSLEFGTDWVGPWWSVLALPAVALVGGFLRHVIVVDIRHQSVVSRLMGVTQILLVLSTILLIVWNR